jgi:hypothetical protein
MALGAPGNRAEVKSLSGHVNGVLVAGAFVLAFEALGAAGLGAREARWRRWLLGSKRETKRCLLDYCASARVREGANVKFWLESSLPGLSYDIFFAPKRE